MYRDYSGENFQKYKPFLTKFASKSIIVHSMGFVISVMLYIVIIFDGARGTNVCLSASFLLHSVGSKYFQGQQCVSDYAQLCCKYFLLVVGFTPALKIRGRGSS